MSKFCHRVQLYKTILRLIKTVNSESQRSSEKAAPLFYYTRQIETRYKFMMSEQAKAARRMIDREKRKASSEEARAKNRERQKRYRETHAEKVNEYQKAWRAKHPDKVKVYLERYWQKKADELAEKLHAINEEKDNERNTINAR